MTTENNTENTVEQNGDHLEARKYRQRAQTAEAEVRRLQGLLDGTRQTILQQVLTSPEHMPDGFARVRPQEIGRVLADAGDLFGEDGRLDAEKLTAHLATHAAATPYLFQAAGEQTPEERAAAADLEQARAEVFQAKHLETRGFTPAVLQGTSREQFEMIGDAIAKALPFGSGSGSGGDGDGDPIEEEDSPTPNDRFTAALSAGQTIRA